MSHKVLLAQQKLNPDSQELRIALQLVAKHLSSQLTVILERQHSLPLTNRKDIQTNNICLPLYVEALGWPLRVCGNSS